MIVLEQVEHLQYLESPAGEGDTHSLMLILEQVAQSSLEMKI